MRNKRGREPLSEKEEKRGGQRPRKSKRKEKKNNKAEGLSKKKRERKAQSAYVCQRHLS